MPEVALRALRELGDVLPGRRHTHRGIYSPDLKSIVIWRTYTESGTAGKRLGTVNVSRHQMLQTTKATPKHERISQWLVYT
jgi:hypothetical protein